MKKTTSKKKIGFIAGGIILLAILWFAIDRQAGGNYRACSSNGCISGMKFEVSFPERCVKNEKNEVLCGEFILKEK